MSYGLRRSSVLRQRSRKMQRTYVERRALVARLLEAEPICQRCHQARSVDVHELLSRARGGSITDETNCRTLCRLCHYWITTHPAVAEAEGWAKSQWPA